MQGRHRACMARVPPPQLRTQPWPCCIAPPPCHERSRKLSPNGKFLTMSSAGACGMGLNLDAEGSHISRDTCPPGYGFTRAKKSRTCCPIWPYVLRADSLWRSWIHHVCACMFPCTQLGANPADDVSFLRVINTPKRKLGAKAIERLKVAQRSLQAFDAAQRGNGRP